MMQLARIEDGFALVGGGGDPRAQLREEMGENSKLPHRV